MHPSRDKFDKQLVESEDDEPVCDADDHNVASLISVVVGMWNGWRTPYVRGASEYFNALEPKVRKRWSTKFQQLKAIIKRIST